MPEDVSHVLRNVPRYESSLHAKIALQNFRLILDFQRGFFVNDMSVVGDTDARICTEHRG